SDFGEMNKRGLKPATTYWLETIGRHVVACFSPRYSSHRDQTQSSESRRHDRHSGAGQQYKKGTAGTRLPPTREPGIQNIFSPRYHFVFPLFLRTARTPAWRVSRDASQPGYPCDLLRARWLRQWAVDSEHPSRTHSTECEDRQRVQRHYDALELD